MEILVPKNPLNNSENLDVIPRKSLVHTLDILAKIPHKIQNNILENPISRKHLGGPVCNAPEILNKYLGDPGKNTSQDPKQHPGKSQSLETPWKSYM